MTLAVAGALLFKSFARLTAVKPGFDADSVLSLKVFLTPPRYVTVAAGKQYIRSGLERLAAMPGVESAAAISQLPLGDPSSTQPFDIEGRAIAPADRPSPAYRAISSGYFRTLRIPLIRGRALTEDDREDSPLVVVVNEAAARAFWPDQDPIGRRFKWATGIQPFDDRWHTVVGVVADVKSSGLDKPEPPAIYAPYTQRMFTWLRWNSFVVRTHGEPQSYARAVREELTKIDPLQPIYRRRAARRASSPQSVAARRFHTGLVDVFAAPGAGAVRGRRLRHDRLLGRGAHARNRRAHGARRLARAASSLMVVARAGGLTALGVVAGIALVARDRAAPCRRCCSASNRSTRRPSRGVAAGARHRRRGRVHPRAPRVARSIR